MDKSIALSQQITTFFVAISTGCLIGLFFDFYRVTGKRILPKLMARHLLDFVWWIAVTGLVFFVLLQLTWGQVRLFIFLGQALGCAAYFYMFSRSVRSGIRQITDITLRFLRLFLRLLLLPLKMIKKILLWPLAIASLLLFKLLHLGKMTVHLLGKIPRLIIKIFKKGLKKFFHRFRRN